MTSGPIGHGQRLSLLVRLTTLEPSWLVWKNCEGAVAGPGDVDSAAAPSAWGSIAAEHRAWARTTGLGPTILCRHAPGLLVAVACEGSDPMRLLQLDVYERAAGVVGHAALRRAAILDPRGFRRLPPGAEGLLRLLAALHRPGRPPRDESELTRVGELVRSDPEGAGRLAATAGRAGARALTLAGAVSAGGWDARAALALELALLEEGARHPRRRLEWLRFRLGGNRCRVLAALEAGRVVAGDREAWLAEVARTHELARP